MGGVIQLDPVDADAFALDDEDEELRRAALATMAAGGLPAEAPPNPPAAAMRRTPSGAQVFTGGPPPPDPITAARGADDIYGGTWGEIPPAAPPALPQQGGMGRALAQPPAPMPRPVAPRGEPGMGRALGDPGAQHTIPPEARERVRALLAQQQQQGRPNPPPDRQVMAEARPNAPGRQPRDYTAEDVGDAIARPFRALGAGLTAASGRTPQRRPGFRERAEQSDARQAAEARTQGLHDRQMADRDASAGLARDRLDLDRQRFEAGEERAGESLALTREREERLARESAARADVAGQLAQRRIRAMDSDEAREAAMDDPASEPSQISQMALRTALAGYPAEARQRLAEQLGRDPDEAIGEMSMRAADQLRRDLPQMFRDVTHRRPGSGRGRGSGGARSPNATPRAQWGTAEDPLVAAAIEAGVNPDLARQMASEGGGGRSSPRARLQAQVMSAETTRTRRDQQVEETHRVPGYVRRPDAPVLGQREQQIARQTAIADHEFTRVAAQLERDLGGLSAAERAQAVMGLGGERAQRVVHGLEVLRTQLRVINNAGNSMGAQQMAEHSMPGLDQRTTANAILANVRAARAVKHQYVAALMETLGYDRAPSGGGGGPRRPTAPAGGPGGDMVRVRHPDGRTGRIPRDRLSAAQARGFEVLP